MEKVGHYHLVIMTRKKTKYTYLQAIIYLGDMKFIDDPKNYILVRRDYNAETPTANLLTTGLTGNIIFRDQINTILALDEDTLTVVFLLYNCQAHTGQLLTDERHKLTHKKMDILKKYTVDVAVLGGTKSIQPKHLLQKFSASSPKRLHQYQGPVSMARCGIKLEAFNTESFMPDKASPGTYFTIWQT